MFKNIFKWKNDNKTEENIYFKDMKDASLFLDKGILTFWSVFLWFIFSQLPNIIEKNIKLFYKEYLIFSIILIWITIILVLFSYILTIIQAKLWYNIQEKNIDYNNWMCKFNFLNFLQDLIRVIYFITLITSIVFTILFYIYNLQNYVW
jgi:hypothetical protein